MSCPRSSFLARHVSPQPCLSPPTHKRIHPHSCLSVPSKPALCFKNLRLPRPQSTHGPRYKFRCFRRRSLSFFSTPTCQHSETIPTTSASLLREERVEKTCDIETCSRTDRKVHGILSLALNLQAASALVSIPHSTGIFGACILSPRTETNGLVANTKLRHSRSRWRLTSCCSLLSTSAGAWSSPAEHDSNQDGRGRYPSIFGA